MTDFSVFKTRVGDIKEPPVFPDGEYLAQVVTLDRGQAGNNNTDYVDITLRIAEPLQGQDVSEFDLSKYTFTDRQWVTDKSLFYLWERFRAINPEVDAAQDVEEAMENYLVGSEVIITVGPDRKATRRKEVKGYKAVG